MIKKINKTNREVNESNIPSFLAFIDNAKIEEVKYFLLKLKENNVVEYGNYEIVFPIEHLWTIKRYIYLTLEERG